MRRSVIALAALGLLAPSIALPQPLPAMSGGYSVDTYAAVPDPVNLSVAPDGTLFVGRDLGGSGGNSGAATRIHRVTPGDPPIVSEIGDPIDDPDVVLADPTGILAPEPDSALVGGRLAGVNPFAGYLASIAPDGTTTTLLPSNQTVQNPVGFEFDSLGTLWVASFDNARLVPVTGSGPGAAIVLPDGPLDLAVEPGTDRIFVSLQSGAIQIYDDAGVLVDPAFTTGRATAFAPGTNGFGTDLYVIAPPAGTLSRVDASGAATVIGTGFGNDGFGLDFGPDGRLYASDFDNDRILVVPETESAAAGAAALVMLASIRWISGRA